MKEVFGIRKITDENKKSVASHKECNELELKAAELIGKPEGNWIEEAAKDALHGKRV